MTTDGEGREEAIGEAFDRVLEEHGQIKPSLEFESHHLHRCYVQALINLREKQRPAMDSDILQEMLNLSGRDGAWKLKKYFGF